MSKYAQIGNNNEVINIIVCEDSVINTITGFYVKCTEESRDAVIGSKYEADSGKFIDPKPYPSWTLDENKVWQPPTPKPESGISDWDEESKQWIDITPVIIDLPTE